MSGIIHQRAQDITTDLPSIQVALMLIYGTRLTVRTTVSARTVIVTRESDMPMKLMELYIHGITLVKMVHLRVNGITLVLHITTEIPIMLKTVFLKLVCI